MREMHALGHLWDEIYHESIFTYGLLNFYLHLYAKFICVSPELARSSRRTADGPNSKDSYPFPAILSLGGRDRHEAVDLVRYVAPPFLRCMKMIPTRSLAGSTQPYVR